MRVPASMVSTKAPMSREANQLRAQLASASRYSPDDFEATDDLRRRLVYQRLVDHVTHVLGLTSLTFEERLQLVELIMDGEQ